MLLTWDSGRWMTHLDTSRLAGPGCYTVGVVLDDNAGSSFRLDLRGGDAGAANHTPKTRPKP